MSGLGGSQVKYQEEEAKEAKDVFKDNLAADDDKRLKVTFQDDNIDNIQDVVDLKQRRSKKTK